MITGFIIIPLSTSHALEAHSSLIQFVQDVLTDSALSCRYFLVPLAWIEDEAQGDRSCRQSSLSCNLAHLI
jgi:hypothetical protein